MGRNPDADKTGKAVPSKLSGRKGATPAFRVIRINLLVVSNSEETSEKLISRRSRQKKTLLPAPPPRRRQKSRFPVIGHIWVVDFFVGSDYAIGVPVIIPILVQGGDLQCFGNLCSSLPMPRSLSLLCRAASPRWTRPRSSRRTTRRASQRARVGSAAWRRPASTWPSGTRP